MRPEMREAALLEQILVVPEPLERLNYLVSRASRGEELPLEDRNEIFEVKGCQSRVWVVPDRRHVGPGEHGDGTLFFRSASDAPVVAALAQTLCEIYNGSSAAEIVSYQPTFFEEAGIVPLLTENRKTGLALIDAAITGYAEAHCKSSLE